MISKLSLKPMPYLTIATVVLARRIPPLTTKMEELTANQGTGPVRLLIVPTRLKKEAF